MITTQEMNKNIVTSRKSQEKSEYNKIIQNYKL